MELWIRSQDSETLMKVNRIDKYGLSIVAFDNECREIYLGRYNSEERALKVLDEIQKLLTPQVIVKPYKIEQEEMIDGNSMLLCMNKIEDFSIKEFSSYLYEMPQE